MQETSQTEKIIAKFNYGNLPRPGDPHGGRYWNKLWNDAKREKIFRLDMHNRWVELHKKYRGKKQDRTGRYPIVGANYLFKTIQGFCAMLTEKYPKAEVKTDDEAPELQIKALDRDIQKWWVEKELQNMLYASVQNMQIYGTTIEKFKFDTEENTSKIVLRDPFNFFPAPGYKLNNLKIPYVCDAYFLEAWEIRDNFGVPEDINIPADANEQLFGTSRETTWGGSKGTASLTAGNLPSNYADVPGSSGSSLANKTLVIEIWIRDKSVEEVPIYNDIQQQPGDPVIDDLSSSSSLDVQVMVNTTVRPRYPGGIRKVTFCPGMVTSFNYGVLDDTRNPNVNWELIDFRKMRLLQEGVPVPAVDQITGQPLIDPNTGQPLMTMMPVDEETAYKMAHSTLHKTYLYNNFPYSATSSLVDTTQWWGFSGIEQLEEMQGKAELLLTKYCAYFDRAMFPILLNPSESGVDNSQITNAPGLVLNPTMITAPHFRYVEVPSPPIGILDLLQFILFQMDIASGTPEVTEGRRPKGISAASAIIALQDKAASLFQPQIRAVDELIRNRGRAHISMVQNFGTESKPIKVDAEFVQFLGIDLQGAFEYMVESGSSAPITKAGRRTQYIELFKLEAMDIESLLEMLEIPKYQRVVERLAEQNTLAGAIEILIQAGLAEEEALQLYQYLMQSQGGTGRGKSSSGGGNKSNATSVQRKPSGPPTTAGEGMRSAFKQMDMVG
jgi:hypothetical protein